MKIHDVFHVSLVNKYRPPSLIPPSSSPSFMRPTWRSRGRHRFGHRGSDELIAPHGTEEPPGTSRAKGVRLVSRSDDQHPPHEYQGRCDGIEDGIFASVRSHALLYLSFGDDARYTKWSALDVGFWVVHRIAEFPRVYVSNRLLATHTNLAQSRTDDCKTFPRPLYISTE